MKSAWRLFLSGSLVALALYSFPTVVPAAFDEINDLRVVYGWDKSNNDDVPVERSSNPATPLSWSGQSLLALQGSGTINPAGEEIKYVLHAISPRLDEEVLGIQTRLTTSSANAVINVYVKNAEPYSLGAWARVIENVDLGIVGNYNRQLLTVAYEDRSGDALIAYRGTSNNQEVRGLNIHTIGGATRPLPVLPGATIGNTTGTVHWVHSVPRLGSDEILVTAANSSNDLYTFMWKGTATGQPFDVKRHPSEPAVPCNSGCVSPNVDLGKRGWDATTLQGNRMMLVYAEGNQLYYRILNRDLAPPNNEQWSAGTPISSSIVTPSGTNYVDIEASPDRTKVAVAAYRTAGTGEVWAAMWDDAASVWLDVNPAVAGPQTLVQITSNAASFSSADVTDPVATAWAGNSTAILVFTEKIGTNSDGVDWAKWTAATQWVTQADAMGADLLSNEEGGFSLQSLFNDQRVMVLFTDRVTKDLWSALYTAGGSPEWLAPVLLTPGSDQIARDDSASQIILGRPQGAAANLYLRPVLTAQNSPAMIPVLSAGSTKALDPFGVVLTDSAGRIDTGVDEDGGSHNEDIELDLSMVSGVEWDGGAICFSGATAKVANDSIVGSCAGLAGGPWVEAGTTAGKIRYSPSPSRSVYLNVTDLFTFNDTLTIGGLGVNFLSGTLATPGSLPIQVKVGIRSDEEGYDTDATLSGAAAIQLVESLLVNLPGTGAPADQVVNGFTQTGNGVGADLLKFKLTPVGGSVKLAKLRFKLATAGTWTLASDLTGVTLSPGGAVTTAIVGGDLAVTLTTPYQIDAATDFTLHATVNNLAVGDSLNVSLAPDYNGAGAPINGDAVAPDYLEVDGLAGTPDTNLEFVKDAFRGTEVIKQHVVSTYSMTLQQRDLTGALTSLSSPDNAIAVTRRLRVNWDETGTASDPVSLQFSKTGGAPWTNVATCVAGTLATGPATSGFCEWDVPATEVSALNAAKVQLAGRTSDAVFDNITSLSGVLTAVAGLTVSAPGAQALNAFTQTGDLPAADELLKFTLTPVGGDVSLTKVRFKLGTSGSWALASDLASVELSPVPGTLTPAFPAADEMELTFPAQTLSTATTFTLKAIVKNLAAGDSLTVKVAPDYNGGTPQDGNASAPHYFSALGLVAGVDPDLALVLGAFRGSEVFKTHTVSTYEILVPPTIPFQNALGISWTRRNVVAPATFQYLLDSNGDGTLDVGPQGFTCNTTGPDACSSPANSPPTNVQATSKAVIRLTGTDPDGQTITVDSATFKVLERLQVATPGSQITDALKQNGSVGGDAFSLTGADLLKFTLTAQGTPSGKFVRVSELHFTLTPSIVGSPVDAPPIGEGQMGSGNFQLIDDATGTVVATAPVSTSPDFSGLTLDINATSRTYRLRADLSGIQPDEQLTVTLASSGIISTGQETATSLTAEGSPVSVTHVVSTYRVTVPPQDLRVIVGTKDWSGANPPGDVPIRWKTYGSAAASLASIRYRINGVLQPPLTCEAAQAAPNLCHTTVPDQVSDNVDLVLSDGTHEALSKPFKVGGIVALSGIDPETLPGGETWIFGHTHTVSWQQQGTFSASVELSIDSGTFYPPSLAVGVNPSAGSTTLGVFSLDCVNFSSATCSSGLAAALSSLGALQTGVDTAKIQVRPTAAGVSTQGSRESQVFKIRPAFLSVTPGGGDIVKGRPVTVTWTPLAGTEPSGVFPIDSVTIKLIDSGNPPVLIETIVPSSSPAPNTGAYVGWQPGSELTGVKIRICDRLKTTICADGPAFNVVDLSVGITPDPVKGFVPGTTANITWQGVDPTKLVNLMLLNSSGTTVLDVITNQLVPPPVSGTRPAQDEFFPWTIPLSLSTPMVDAKIRLEQSDNANVWAESALFTIKGELKVDAPNGGEKLPVGQSTTIGWSILSGTTSQVRLRVSTTGSGGPWTVLALNAPGTSFPWTPNTVTNQARIEVCDAADLTLCDTSDADFTVSGKLALAEYTPGGQASNAFVELPTVTDAELYRFQLTRTGEDAQLGSLIFDLSAVSGISASDLSGLSLLKDGTAVTAGFAVLPAGSPTSIEATLSGVTVTGTSNFVLKGSVANLAANEEMTISLVPAKIQAQGFVSQAALETVPGAISGSVSNKRHFAKTYLLTAPVAGANWAVNTNQNIAWTTVGGASANNVTISYSVDGGQTYTQIVSSPSVSNPFPWLVPLTGISAQAKIKIADRSDPSVVGYSGGAKLSNFFNITGQVTVTAPAADGRYADGLPRWPVGMLQMIQWTTVGSMSQFRVYADGVEVPGSPTTNTSLSFTPANPSPSSVIRVVDATPNHPAAEGTATVVFSEVQVIDPNAASAWQVGSAQTIRWVHTGLQTVDLFYRTGGGAWQPITLAYDATQAQLSWSPPAAARSPQVEILIRDAIETNPAKAAFNVSSVFKVYGNLQLSAVSNVAVNISTALSWATTPAASVPRVALFLIDVARGQTSTIAADTANTGSYSWTPALATSQAKVRICDKDFPSTDAQACHESNVFPITGIGVDPILVGPHIVGSPLAISWTQEGVASAQVRLAYSADGGTTWKDMSGAVCTLPCGTLAPTGPTGTYNWTVTDDLSRTVKVRVADNASPAYGESAVFEIAGRLTVTSPAPATIFSVTDTMPIVWTKLGTIPMVDLEYSLDGGTSWSPIISGVAGTSYNWSIPTSAISNNLLVRVLDAAGVGASPAHPFTEGRSGVLQAGAKFTLTSPAGGESWAVNSPQTLGWSVIGDGVTSIRLAYSGDGVTYTEIVVKAMAGTNNESGTHQWNVADVVDLMGDPQATPTRPFTVRVTDATVNHPSAPSTSPSLNAFYYRVDWEVRDAANNVVLNNLQVIDSTGWTNQPDFTMTGQQTRYYPYLTQASTLWLLANNNGATDLSQRVVNPEPDLVSVWASDRDQTRVAKIEVTSSDAVTWQVHAQQNYDAVNDVVELSAWLEKSGKIVDTLLTDGFVEFYEDGTLIRTLPQPSGSGPGLTADANGNFRFTWDLKRDDGTSVPDGKTYFAKTIIRRLGRSFSTGGALNITIPKKILTGGSGVGSGVTLGELQNELDPIKTDVGAIRTIVTPLPQQLTDAQGAIQADIATAKGQLSTEISGAQSAIQSDIATAKSDLSTQIGGVQSYLSDANAGLPKILSNQQTTNDQLKAQRKGKLLNRETTVEQGDSITLRYAPGDPAMVPTIRIYGPGFSVGPTPMAPDGSGLYQYAQAFDNTFQLGEYTVVVSEAASATGLSDGTVDNLALSLRAPVAKQTAVDALQGTLTSIETKLDTDIIPKLNLVVGYTDQVETLLNQVKADTQILVTNWGALDAATVMNELSNLSLKLGAPATGSLAGDLVQIRGEMAKDATVAKATDLAGLASQASINALDTKLGTPSTGTIAGDIAAISGSSGCPTPPCSGSGGDLTSIQAAVDELKAAMGTLQLQSDGTTLAQISTAARDNAAGARTSADTAASEAGLARTAADAAKTAADNTLGVATAGRDYALAARDNAANAETAANTAATEAGTARTSADAAAAVATAARDRATEARDRAIEGRDYALAGRDYALTARDNAATAATNAGTAATAAINAQTSADAARDRAVEARDRATEARDAATALQGLTTEARDRAVEARDASVNAETAASGAQSVAGEARDRAIEGRDYALTARDNAATARDRAIEARDRATEARDATTAIQTSADAARDRATEARDRATEARDATTAIQTLATEARDNAATAASEAGLARTAADTAALEAGAARASADTAATVYAGQLTAIQGDLTTLAGVIDDPAQADRLQLALDDLTTIKDQLAALPTDGSTTDLTAINAALTALSASVEQVKTNVAALSATDTDTLLGKLETLQETVASAQGSAAAVGLSQSAYTAASEAVTILRQLQADIQAKGAGSPTGLNLLGQLNDKLTSVSSSVTVIPGKLNSDELSEQLKELAKRAEGVATDKGYHFDSLYEMAAGQSTDVKTVRNQVEELKQLLEVQRSILERNLDTPVMKSWFEAQ